MFNLYNSMDAKLLLGDYAISCCFESPSLVPIVPTSLIPWRQVTARNSEPNTVLAGNFLSPSLIVADDDVIVVYEYEAPR